MERGAVEALIDVANAFVEEQEERDDLWLLLTAARELRALGRRMELPTERLQELESMAFVLALSIRGRE